MPSKKEVGMMWTGGKRPPGLDNGYWVQPSDFTHNVLPCLTPLPIHVADSSLTGTQDAKREGGKLLTGGKRPPGLDKGYYMQPTVFTGMEPDMRLWREEVFGPVLAAMTFKTEEEAVELANASEFGLAGAVISADEQVGSL